MLGHTTECAYSYIKGSSLCQISVYRNGLCAFRFKTSVPETENNLVISVSIGVLKIFCFPFHGFFTYFSPEDGLICLSTAFEGS
jgi:hypothetical protein